MSAAARIAPAGQEGEILSVLIATDPPGPTESPALPNPRIAIHLGQSVLMACQRAGQKHRGLAVHGDIDIVPANTACVWDPDRADTALIVSVKTDLLAATVEELGARCDKLEIRNRFQIRDLQLEHIGWTLKAEMEAGYPNGRIFRDSLATALAAALIARHSSLAPAPFSSFVSQTMSGRRLRQALSYIEDNLNRDLSLAEIAREAGVSVSHLKTTFRQMTGLPVHRYVIQRRVERARALLSQGSLSISQVAQEAGFAHQSHLANHMRRILGCSPKAVRSL